MVLESAIYACCQRKKHNKPPVLHKCELQELQQWLAWQDMLTNAMVTQMLWEWATAFWLDFRPISQNETRSWYQYWGKNMWLARSNTLEGEIVTGKKTTFILLNRYSIYQYIFCSWLYLRGFFSADTQGKECLLKETLKLPHRKKKPAFTHSIGGDLKWYNQFWRLSGWFLQNW